MTTPAEDRGFLAEFWVLLKREKKWWLIPLLLVAIVLVAVAVMGGDSKVAPFVYSFR